MSTVQLIAKDKRNKILEDSIGQQRRLILTQNSPAGWRMFKSQFAAGSANSHLLLVTVPVAHDESTMTPPERGAALGVTFRTGHKKCMFGTTLVSSQDGDRQDLVALSWPDHLQQVQRRVYERAEPPNDEIVPVRFWREETPATARIEARTIRHGQLENLSAGGMRVKVANSADVQLGCTYRCAFAPRSGKPSLVVDAVARHREAVEQGRTSVGLQFIGLEATLEGRRILEKLAQTVNHFQRAQPRKRR